VDLKDEICRLQFELLEEARNNKLLMEHLFISLQNISGKQKTFQTKIHNGMLHPFHKKSTFKCNLNNNGWNLKRCKDFLESD
jgi:hypothetical protein